MLTTKLINPEIMAVLAKCGHGDKILISDANYPVDSKSGNAKKVYLALEKDCPTATQVLAVLKSVVNFEKAELMMPDTDKEPEIFEEFRNLLPEAEFATLGRYEYYDACCESCVKLAIHSGESRIFANILLTVGVA